MGSFLAVVETKIFFRLPQAEAGIPSSKGQALLLRWVSPLLPAQALSQQPLLSLLLL